MKTHTLIEAKKASFRLFSTTDTDVMQKIREAARKRDRDAEYDRAIAQRNMQERKARKAA